MTSPLNIFSGFSVWIVSLICLPLAAMLLILPMQRLIEPMWPVAIEEHILSDGSTKLVQIDSQSNRDGEGRLRSRPLSAAVLDRNAQPSILGYVVAIRYELAEAEGSDSIRSEILPTETWWRPDDLISEATDDQSSCRLALRQSDQVPQWLPCETIRRVVLPNQLSMFGKLQVAMARLDEAVKPAAVDPDVGDLQEQSRQTDLVD